MVSHDAMKAVADKFNSKEDLKNDGKAWKSLKFQFKPADGAGYYIEFNEDGSISLKDGEIADAKDTFTASDQVLEDVLTGKLDGIKAYLFGKLKVSGDLSSAQKLVSLLKRAG